MSEVQAAQPHVIELDPIIDTHTHPRNMKKDGDGRMEVIVPLLAAEYGVIGAMGNGKPAVTSIEVARSWRKDIESCKPTGSSMQVLIGMLVRDDTSPHMVCMSWDKPGGTQDADFLKIFLSGVSNDNGNSVSDTVAIDPVIRATTGPFTHTQRPMPVTFHAERKFDADGTRLEMPEREWYAIRHDIEPLIRRNPEGIYTIAHVTDGRTVDWIIRMNEEGFHVYGEIGAHYLYRCHEDLYEARDGKGTAFQAHELCWPIYKAFWSMMKLRWAATSGLPYFHYGSDSACHIDDPTQEKGVKITCEGEVCGGVAILPAVGISLIIELFMKLGVSIEILNAFLSGNARKKLGLPAPTHKVQYAREDWVVDEALWGEGQEKQFHIVTFMRGETRHWKKVA